MRRNRTLWSVADGSGTIAAADQHQLASQSFERRTTTGRVSSRLCRERGYTALPVAVQAPVNRWAVQAARATVNLGTVVPSSLDAARFLGHAGKGGAGFELQNPVVSDGDSL